jgi:hypothetical protein
MTTNCGGHGHSAECLCDVVITEQVPINYHFDDVWHAGIVARATGYRGGGGAQLADFLEALAHGYDATRRVANAAANYVPKDKVHEAWLADIRRSGLKARVEEQLQDGHSILDVPDILMDGFERIVAALSRAQPSPTWTWDNMEWLAFEAYMLAKASHNVSDMARVFSLTRPQCLTLIKSYGRQADTTEAADSKVARAWELFEQYEDKQAPELMAMLATEGYTYTLDGLRAARQRWRRHKRQHAAA